MKKLGMFYCLLIAFLICDKINRPLTIQEVVAKTISSVVLIESGGDISAGFVATKYGHIVCVAHGISRKISKVYFRDGDTVYKAVLKAKSRGLDVAILQIPNLPPHIKPLELDTSPMYREGIVLTTIGHPDAFLWSTSSGILSREVIGTRRLLQITVPINPGNSGGPVLNDKGQVVGIVRSTIPALQLIGFAIPSDVIAFMLRGAKL